MAKHFPTVSDSTFEQEVLRSEQPVLVDFWAGWYGPCKLVAPTVEALARDYSGRLRVVKSDVDENANSAARYGVRGIPTLALFKDGELKGPARGEPFQGSNREDDPEASELTVAADPGTSP